MNNLDESSVTKKEIAIIKESFAGANSTASFSYLGHSAGCWYLNAQGKICHIDHHTKVINMTPVTAAVQRGVK